MLPGMNQSDTSIPPGDRPATKRVGQTLLLRFSVATSIFALLVAAVAVSSDGGGGDDESLVSGPVQMVLTEFALSPSSVSVPVGGSMEVTNNGSMPHNVKILDTPIGTTDLGGGGTETLELASLEPGRYEVFCSIPGHKDSGMTGVLVVTDGSVGDAEAATVDAETDMDPSSMGDIGAMNPASDEAKAMNKRMEEAMTGGVNDFLEFADQYGEGNVEAGNERIEPEILPDGTKRFALTAEVTDWQVSPGKVVKAWTYNGRVPGPWIRVEPGDKVQVDITNKLPISTDVHWHGVGVPNSEDGLAPITQDFIRPFETYTYSFTAVDQPRLGMYHAHMHGQEAIINGLFAMFQIGDVEIPSGNFNDMVVPPDVEIGQEVPMVLNDAGVIGLSLNGKAFPETEPIVAKTGEWVLFHYYNEGLVGHPMHLHRQEQLVISKDGYALDAPYRTDTLWISPGERYSVLVKVDEPGIWAFHCHIVSHAESEDGLFGMVSAMIVTE